MATACFEQGTIVQIEGSEHRLSRKIDDYWQLEHSKTGRIVEYTQQDLLRMTAEQTLTFPGSVSIYRGGSVSHDLSPADLELAKLRRSYVLAVLNTPNSRGPLEAAIHGAWERLKSPAELHGCGRVTSSLNPSMSCSWMRPDRFRSPIQSQWG